jgi:DNA-binding CsgD family transcriptional regulator
MRASSRDALRDEVLGYLRGGTSVSLRGLPGSGRSSLLRSVVEALAAAGWKIVEVAGNPALTDRPLEALAVAEIAAPPGGRAPSAVAAAVAALRRTTENPRTVVAIDDADVLDAASIGVISAAIAGRPVPLLATASAARRAPELSLPALIAPGVRLAVPPLSFEDSQELVQSVVHGRIATDTVSRIHARAGGMPALVRAIADNAVRQGLLTRRDGAWTAARGLWTPHLGRTVEPFLLGLDDDTLDALVKLSIVGSVDVDVAQQLAGWRPLEELDERGLLSFATTPESVSVGVYPPLLAEHLRRERVGVRRLRLLREIDATFAGAPSPLAPAPPAPLGGEEATGEADAVVNRRVYEKRNAALLVRRAEWERRRDAASAIAYADVLMTRGGEHAEAERVLQAELPEEDARGRALLAVWRATLHAFGPGGLGAALDQLDAADTPELGAWRRLLAAYRADLRLLLERAPTESELYPADPAPADPGIVATELVLRAEQLVALGRPLAALEALDRVQTTDATLLDAATVCRGIALIVAGRLDDAEAHARRLFDDGLARSEPGLLAPHGYALAVVLLLRGDEAALRDHIGTLLSVGYTPLRHTPHLLGALVVASRSAALAGRAFTARSLADQAAALGVAFGPFPLMAVEHAATNALLAEGASHDAVAAALWAGFEAARARGHVVTGAMLAVRALELRPDAAWAAAFEESVAGTEPGTLPRTLARLAATLVDPSPDARRETGNELIAAGLTGFGVALRLSALRRWLQADDRRAEAEARELRQLAERLGGSYAETIGGALPHGALSPREREIAELAGGGLSNHDIAVQLTLSVRTVENHLHRVFQKLGVDGRSDLAAALGLHR